MQGANPLKGEGAILLDGKSYPLRFTWSALAELQEKYPSGFNTARTDVLADLIAWGLRHVAPELTPEKIMDLSPPMIESIEAVNKALMIAYYGEKGPPKTEEGENPPKAPLNGSGGAETSLSASDFEAKSSGI